MADEQSIQLLDFNFASRTCEFKRLAKGLRRSVSAFSSFMRQNLDPVVIVDKCSQCVDKIGIGAHDLPDMLEKLSAVFTCIRESELKPSTDKCAFGLKEIQFLGNTITSEGLNPIKQKIVAFSSFLQSLHTKARRKAACFYKLTKKETDFETNEEHNVKLTKLTQDLHSACDVSLRLPMTNRQYAIMAEASFYAAGFVLMIEDYTQTERLNTKFTSICQSTRKNFLPFILPLICLQTSFGDAKNQY